MPSDPEDQLWSFVFSGLPLFVNISTPCHHKRKSRNFGAQLTFIINPRQNFDVVAGNTSSGNEVRNHIRRRISKYDEAPVCKYLGMYGTEGNSEWRQYAVADDNDSTHIHKCPLNLDGKSKSTLNCDDVEERIISIPSIHA